MRGVFITTNVLPKEIIESVTNAVKWRKKKATDRLLTGSADANICNYLRTQNKYLANMYKNWFSCVHRIKISALTFTLDILNGEKKANNM